MQPRSASLLWDVQRALERIHGFVLGSSWDDYRRDSLLRSAVERQFEIAGEAMSVLRKIDPRTAERVPNSHRMIGMRNILIHAYAKVNDDTVWRAIGDIEPVLGAVEAMLAEAGPPGTTAEVES